MFVFFLSQMNVVLQSKPFKLFNICLLSLSVKHDKMVCKVCFSQHAVFSTEAVSDSSWTMQGLYIAIENPLPQTWSCSKWVKTFCTTEMLSSAFSQVGSHCNVANPCFNVSLFIRSVFTKTYCPVAKTRSQRTRSPLPFVMRKIGHRLDFYCTSSKSGLCNVLKERMKLLRRAQKFSLLSEGKQISLNLLLLNARQNSIIEEYLEDDIPTP